MANGKNDKKRKKDRDPEKYRAAIKWTGSIVLIAFGLILLISLEPLTLGGPIGIVLFSYAFGFLGVAAYLLPVVAIGIGLMLMLDRAFVEWMAASGLLLMLISFLGLLGLATSQWGGTAGIYVGGLASSAFGVWGAIIILLAVAAVGLVLSADVTRIAYLLQEAVRRTKNAAVENMDLGALTIRGGQNPDEAAPVPVAPALEPADAPAPPMHDAEPVVNVFNRPVGAPTGAASVIQNFDGEYDPPPLSILGEDKGKPGTGDIKANANIIKRTFQNFGINVEMDEVSVGPTVTRYAVKPAEGVRLSKIVSLQGNLELALAAHPVRIEAPIPGKSLVGIEVPNTTKAMVGLGGVLSAPEWTESKKPLLAALGRDITGTPHYVNIAKMPHGLVAGATGSGKSVAIHALITSLLYRNGPNQLRFIMIDPKRVELTLYNGIPHLLTPVITDPKKAILSLKWAAKEMERRYNILETETVRDIESYHSSVVEPARKSKSEQKPESMPYIVIVIDELADIMQKYPRELEASIVRLAQMSRAVGIHLVLSTQRPSVNVITGLIKANVPTRLALQVASQIDSRTILDQGGAETLLGAGDMLYLSSDMQKPVRIQTAYISEGEVKKVASYIKSHNAGEIPSLELGGNMGGESGAAPNDAIMLAGDLGDDDVDDDLYDQARAAVEEAGRASTSYLQRKLRIGYSRAARLMDLLEQKGVIGAADGSKPREVLSRAGAGAPPPGEDTDVDVF
ncbi:MAG TPA: DNA translocase FtsK [Candidatus Paceibacterota bacterium]|nr:DNA translocase FtsK [Candidatus Paceibacterota bacterium]